MLVPPWGKYNSTPISALSTYHNPPIASSKEHILQNFKHSLVGVGTLCDADCTIVFTKSSVTVLDPQDKTILTGWRKRTGPKLWRLSFCPQHQTVAPTGSATASLKAFSDYDLPCVEALVHYLHAAAGFPVRSTWIAAIKSGNYSSWPGITY